MRIFHTAHTYSPSLNGVAEVVRQISERLAARGHEVHVGTSRLSSQQREEVINGVYVHRFDVSGSKVEGLKGNIDEYRSFVHNGNWDLMVNHCVQTWSTDTLIAEIERFRWPCILVTHGLSGFGNAEFDHYYRDLASSIGKYAKWVSISRITEEFEFSRAFDLRQPTFINNGIDLRDWADPDLCLRDKWEIGDRPWLVDVSNHNPFKCHDKVFILAKLLAQLDARFTIVGRSYPMARFGLGRFGIKGGCFYTCSVKEKLFNTVSLRTDIPRSHVISAIKEADVLVSTSNWEANSIVILEAMAAGTPWVSFDVGSVRHNSGGLIVGDLMEMAAKVSLLVKNPILRSKLGREGIARVREHHSWDNIVSQYYSLYETVIGEHAGKEVRFV